MAKPMTDRAPRPVIAYRVQGADGRGPWRPGFSHMWIEDDAPAGRLQETIMDLLPIERLRSLPVGFHYGCACRTLSSLLEWFTPIEMVRLSAHGFYPVRLNVDRVVVESQFQMLIARSRAFVDGVTRLSWPSEAAMRGQR